MRDVSSLEISHLNEWMEESGGVVERIERGVEKVVSGGGRLKEKLMSPLSLKMDSEWSNDEEQSKEQTRMRSQ